MVRLSPRAAFIKVAQTPSSKIIIVTEITFFFSPSTESSCLHPAGFSVERLHKLINNNKKDTEKKLILQNVLENKLQYTMNL